MTTNRNITIDDIAAVVSREIDMYVPRAEPYMRMPEWMLNADDFNVHINQLKIDLTTAIYYLLEKTEEPTF